MSELMPSSSDFETFLKDHDLLWDRPPTRWQDAPFIGNGLSGALLMFDMERNALKWFLGRSDVGRLDYPGKARDPIRVQIGSLVQVLRGGARIVGCDLRLDLWNAEVRGVVQTDRGDIALRAFAPSGSASIVVETRASNPDVAWDWECAIKPDGEVSVSGGASVFVAEDFVAHPRTEVPSGGFAVAWGESSMEESGRRLVCSIGSTPVNRGQWSLDDSGVSAKEEAEAGFEKLMDTPPQNTLDEHRAWWHRFYRRGFFSFTDTELESLYWIQLYKFASTTRPDRPMIDNHGVWSAYGTYGFATWDFNVQSTYRVHLTANMVDFGGPLVRFLERNFNEETLWDEERGEYRAGMRQQTFLRYRFFGRDHWEHNEDLPCDGPAKFLWGVHNYVMHYRHTLDEAMAPRALLMLEGGINAMLAGMRLEEDGRWHIPCGGSWEAWRGRDPTGLLAVLRWALSTALEFAERAGAPEAKKRRWGDILANLAPYPEDENGYLLGEGQPPVCHRHWTQLMMLFPLDICDPSDSEQIETLKKSIDLWARISAGLDGSEPDAGFACPAAIALYAYLSASSRADQTALIPELADIFLHRETHRNPGLWASTMYSEWAGPVIETPIFMASAIQECFLQSRRDGVHVFPAVPDAWPDAVFADWRAEGGFLVSASRRGGRTEWVLIRSLLGAQTTLHTDMRLEDIHWNGARGGVPENCRVQGNRSVELRLRAGERLVLSVEPEPDLSVRPVAERCGPPNSFGLNRRFLEKRSGFEQKVLDIMDALRDWDKTLPAGSNPFSP